MISFRHKGDFSKLTRFLERAKEVVHLGCLDKYGREGVAALASATPVDTGLTADSWYYKITNDGQSAKVTFYNSNIQNGVPIAIILQLFCSTDTELAMEAGYRVEIMSILRFSLFLTNSQMRHGGRLLSFE